MIKPQAIDLYAELLLNIRTVTLYGSILTEATESTKAEVNVDGNMITLTHEEDSASIPLPAKVQRGGKATLELPESATKEVTVRLQLEERMPGLLRFEDQSIDVVPWSASSLSQQTQVQCAKCGNALVRPGTIKAWKDLPSENWAEMMDFWHCHKPTEHQSHQNDANTEKGYAASLKLTALPGTGLVDTSSFLLAQQDCCGIEVPKEEMSRPQAQKIQCARCSTTVGALDEQSEGYRLHKWALAIRSRNGSRLVEYSTQKWISAQLLSLVDSQGVRKFVVHDALNDTNPALLLWMFTSDLSFSSSVNSAERQDPTRAMKVLWKRVDDPQKALGEHTTSLEEVVLPQNVCKDLLQCLEKSRNLLPAPARMFQEWNTGLLERFDARDVAD